MLPLRHVALWMVLVTAGVQAADNPPAYDIVIRGGLIADGSGGRSYRADLAIKEGRIGAIGQVPAGAGRTEIDAAGRMVAPGFIDVHTHADGDIHTSPAAENFVRDGVTTIVTGNCGGSVQDVGNYFERIGKQGAGLNVATLYGHNTVLRAVKGDRKGELTPTQMAQAKDLVRTAMRQGAVGFSTGLIYNPGQFSPTEEIIELARVAGESGGIYASHMRNEGSEIFNAIDEAVRIGREAKVRIQISHFKLPTTAAKQLGGAEATLGRVAAARNAGLEIGVDQYPYTASSTSIATLVPDEFLEQGVAGARERLKDPAQFDAALKAMVKEHSSRAGQRGLAYVVVAYARSTPQFNGKNIVQIAQAKRLAGKTGNGELLSDAATAAPEPTLEEQCRAALEVFVADNASCVFHTMDDTEVDRIMADPNVAIASDSGVRAYGVGVPHPRGYGTNARVLGRYAREKKLFSMEEAVRKMTSLPAGTFRMKDRGLLKEGFVADVVVFDPAKVIDRATFEKPHQYPEGIADVIVNGVAVLQNGKMTGSLPGRPVFGPGKEPSGGK